MSAPVGADNDTELVITGTGIPRYAMRGLTQTLTPIAAAAQLTRDINGRAMDLSVNQFRKYASTISCQDQRPPALDAIWPGMEVTIECVAELCRPAAALLGRPVVAGSERTEGDFVFYRPVLQMVFLGFETSTPEWEATVTWSMEFEEV